MEEMTMTNIGLRLSGAHTTTHNDSFVLGLNCLRHSPKDGSVEWLGIYLERFGLNFVRTNPSTVHTSATKHFWGKEPVRASAPIYIQPSLLPDQKKRTEALGQNIIFVRYDQNVAQMIEARHGIPVQAYTEIEAGARKIQYAGSDKFKALLEREAQVNPHGGAVFRIKVAEEFLGVHLMMVRTGPSDDTLTKICMVISLQWDGAELRLIYALYESTSELMRYIDRDPEPIDASGYLERCQDYFLENRRVSDLTGLLSQERMPTTINIPSETTETTETSRCVISVQKDRGLLVRVPSSRYHYLVLTSKIVQKGST